MREPVNVIIIGASGHGKVIADIVVKSGDRLSGFLDDNISTDKKVFGCPILGKVSDIQKYTDNAKFVIGVGNNYIRRQIAESNDVRWYTATHPSSVLGMNIDLGVGTVVMANAVINPEAKIGDHCIINTGAVVEHDNAIADFVHISPNATTGGNVKIGELTHIGIGATVKNNISICPECIIGAGAVVVDDITEKGTYIGVPARKI